MCVKYVEVQVCVYMEEPETNAFHVEVPAYAFTLGTGTGVVCVNGRKQVLHQFQPPRHHPQ